MEIKQLSILGRQIWGGDKLALPQIIIRMGKIFGDICRWERNDAPGDRASENELKKEFGNMIFSTIRWCDDLGYDPEICVNIAIEAQQNYCQTSIDTQGVDVKQLLAAARQIWPKRALPQIIVRMGKVFGDICRYTRNEKNTDTASENELKKELGNMIFSTICWCDDLGYDPEECINIAVEAQKDYRKKIKKDV